MAQKKTTKKTTSKSKQTAAKKSTRPRKKVYMPNALARGIGGAVCLFFAVLLVLGMFDIRAVVVDLLCDGVKGLVGYGFWITALVLAAAGFLLLGRRERSVQLRLWCLGLLPLVWGAFCHMLISPYTYTPGFAILGKLWKDGTGLFSGGVLGGMLSISFTTWFSQVGAGILFVLALLTLLAGACHLTPARLADLWHQHQDRRVRYDQEDDYDDYDYYEEEALPPQGEDWADGGYEENVQRRREPFWPLRFRRPDRKRAPDLPLDDPQPAVQPEGPPMSNPSQEAPTGGTRPGEDRTAFDARPEGKVPDSALDELEPVPEAVPLDLPADDQQAWTSVGQTPPPTPKVQPKLDLRQETAAVAQSIEQNLGMEPPAYQYPSLDLLTAPNGESTRAAHEELEGTLERLSSVLLSFGIDGHVTGAVQGPSVTRYEVALEQGVRLNKLTNLSDDVALALGVSNVRIAPVPGKISVVGIEVPNQVVTPVPIREVLSAPDFGRHKSSVAFSVGKDIGGNYIVGDCSKLPHMLIAGTTGSGKSVCINSLIVSMLYKSTPEEVRLIMVDPKMVELGGYNGIPHLLIPVVTDPKKAAGALQWAVTEMMKRYRLFAEASVRELTSYNQWAKRQETAQTMPKVVIVIDELADLMLVAAKEVEESICRVAQMGRAAGMHLVIATQRPSADVITGLMKANIPSRIAFAVASSLESRIILDNTGAEKLVGKGDMLWFPLGSGKPLRVQGCFISDEEVAAVVDSVKQNSPADYDNEVMEQIEQHVSESEKKGKSSGAGAFSGGEGPEEQDELFSAAVDVIMDLGQASVSMLQRRLKLGYARAARLVDQMEGQGIVGPFEGSKPRQLLITKEQWAQMQNGGGEVPLPESPPPVEEELLSFDPVPQKFE